MTQDEFNAVWELAMLVGELSVIEDGIERVYEVLRKRMDSMSEDDRKFLFEQITTASMAIGTIKSVLLLESSKLEVST